MVCPHVSGVVVLIQATRLVNNLTILLPGTENDMNTDTIRGILHVTARDKGVPGYDELYGYGVVNVYQTIQVAIEQ